MIQLARALGYTVSQGFFPAEPTTADGVSRLLMAQRSIAATRA